MKKQFIGGCIALLLLTGCTNVVTQQNEESSKLPLPTDSQQISISILAEDDDVAKHLQYAAQQYSVANKEVQITVSTPEDEDEYSSVLRVMLKSEQPPTMFFIRTPNEMQEFSGYLEELSHENWVNNAVANTLSAVTVQGKILGMPAQIKGIGILYNTEIFKEAGINPENINSFQRLSDTTAVLQQQIDNGQLLHAFPSLKSVFSTAFSDTEEIGEALANFALANEFSSMSALLKAEKLEFAFQDQLKDFVDLQQEYTIAISHDTEAAVEALANEQVAMLFHNSDVYEKLLEENPKTVESFGFLPVPMENGAIDHITVEVPQYWAVNSRIGSNEKKAAKKFLDWLYTSEDGKKIIVQDLEWLGPLNNFGKSVPKGALRQSVKEYADAGKTLPYLMTGVPDGWSESYIGEGIKQYLQDEISFVQLIQRAKEAFGG